MRARDCLFWINSECVCAEFFITYSKKLLLLVFLLISVGGASKTKIVSHLRIFVAIFFVLLCFKYFFPTFFSKIFVSKFIFNISLIVKKDIFFYALWMSVDIYGWFYGCAWVSMGVNGCLGVFGCLWASVCVTTGIWVSIGVYGYRWVSWLPMGVHVYRWGSWLYMSFHRFVSVSMDVYGYLWISMGVWKCCGGLWAFLGVYEGYRCLWVFMSGSRYFMGAQVAYP